MQKPSLLDTIASPADLRRLAPSQLDRVAGEVRAAMIEAVSCTGGHLGAGLGVVELTVALHYVFETPQDVLIWDVGHQAYPHKILTGRRDRMHTLRQEDGLSGFTKRAESAYDPFGAAHAATSISAALGFCAARDRQGRDNHVIAVIGDGSMSAGMAYEAINNASATTKRLIVVLNDNDMSIAPPVGAMRHHLARSLSSGAYRRWRRRAKAATALLPSTVARVAKKAEGVARSVVQGGGVFEELGFHYIGVLDGHDIGMLTDILRNAKDIDDKPVLVHVRTQKGKGYQPAEAAADKYHGVSPFNVITGAQDKGGGAQSYTQVFGESLLREGARDPAVVAITAAMPAGTGVDRFAKAYPDRAFDVGIAEQHAVTFAAGLAADGMKPFAAIYSTFLQRGYDQVVHDVALQRLPVRFAVDRAGLVGADGPTHAGAFDIGFLGALPDFVVMAAADGAELSRMVATCAAIDDRPSAVRYPRGETPMPVDVAIHGAPLEIGKGRIVREGTSIALVSFGSRLGDVCIAADRLAACGYSATVFDARFAKPLDEIALAGLAREHAVFLTIEEGARGGFGAFVLAFLAMSGLLDRGLKVRTLTLPDRFQDQASPAAMLAEAGLDAEGIVSVALAALGKGALAPRAVVRSRRLGGG